jgi:hypothetical protein
MTWLQHYRVRYCVVNSIWIFPLLGMMAALVAVSLLHHLEVAMDW